MGVNIERRTIGELTTNGITITFPDMYASYLLTVTYGNQSSIFFIGVWVTIQNSHSIYNALKDISIDIGNGYTVVKITSNSGTLINVECQLTRI